MDAYLHSLIIFAIAANIVAIPLIILGRRFGLSCSPLEYLMIYLTWAVFVALIGSVFDDLNHAMQELNVSDTALKAIFSVGGVLAALSLLPKVLFLKHTMNSTLLTSITSIAIAVVFAKFAVLVFLFTAD